MIAAAQFTIIFLLFFFFTHNDTLRHFHEKHANYKRFFTHLYRHLLCEVGVMHSMALAEGTNSQKKAKGENAFLRKPQYKVLWKHIDDLDPFLPKQFRSFA